MLIKIGEIKGSGIYGIFDVNGVCYYVGGSPEVNNAYNRHDSMMKKLRYNTNKKVMQEIYHIEDLYFKVLEFCDKAELDERETHYIELYKDTICNTDKKGKRRKSKSTPEEAAKRRKANLGGNNPRATINENIAAEIKYLCHNTKMKHREIAEMYGVTNRIVGAISSNYRWGHVEEKMPEFMKVDEKSSAFLFA